MEIQAGMSKEGRQFVAEGLEQLFVDTYALYLKTQMCHWNVRGDQFYSLHLLFESHYKEMADAVDEIAERLGALGFFVQASLSTLKGKTRIRDEEKLLNAKDMLTALVEGHEVVCKEARRILEVAEREKDGGTCDLLGRRLVEHEKMAWFLRSHLC